MPEHRADGWVIFTIAPGVTVSARQVTDATTEVRIDRPPDLTPAQEEWLTNFITDMLDQFPPVGENRRRTRPFGEN